MIYLNIITFIIQCLYTLLTKMLYVLVICNRRMLNVFTHPISFDYVMILEQFQL